MRFLGNKESILNDIEALLQNKGLLYKQLTFFDAFAGSGSVSDYFKKYYNIIIVKKNNLLAIKYKQYILKIYSFTSIWSTLPMQAQGTLWSYHYLLPIHLSFKYTV